MGVGRVPPRHFSLGNFCWPTREKGARKKGGKLEEKKENLKGKRWKIENGRGKGMKKRRGLFSLFLFFFLSFFRLSVFETTKICLGSTKMDNFYREKSYFTLGKYRKNWLCPLWKISLLRPCWALSSCPNSNRKYSMKSCIKCKPCKPIDTRLGHISIGDTAPIGRWQCANIALWIGYTIANFLKST